MDFSHHLTRSPVFLKSQTAFKSFGCLRGNSCSDIASRGNETTETSSTTEFDENVSVDKMTIGQLLEALRPAAIWQILGAIAVLVAGAFSLGIWIAGWDSSPLPPTYLAFGPIFSTGYSCVNAKPKRSAILLDCIFTASHDAHLWVSLQRFTNR